jgi:hypothetical protein
MHQEKSGNPGSLHQKARPPVAVGKEAAAVGPKPFPVARVHLSAADVVANADSNPKVIAAF